MRSSSRYPRVGDILIVDDTFRGMVSRVTLDKWSHQDGVYVIWQTKKPWDYGEDRGYAGVNIHNLRRNFRIFREGKEIL